MGVILEEEVKAVVVGLVGTREEFTETPGETRVSGAAEPDVGLVDLRIAIRRGRDGSGSSGTIVMEGAVPSR